MLEFIHYDKTKHMILIGQRSIDFSFYQSEV
jgi:hypothetical protein